MAEEQLHLVQLELRPRDPDGGARMPEKVRMQIVDSGLAAASLDHSSDGQ
jgi:hypothetical protein